MKQLYLILFLAFCFSSFGQSPKKIHGTVLEKSLEPIPDVLIQLISNSDTLLSTSNNLGLFHFDKIKSDSFTLILQHLTYKTLEKKFQLSSSSLNLEIGTIIMEEKVLIIDEVIIKAPLLIELKADTIQYNIREVVDRKGMVEELLKSLPGFQIDKNGMVSLNGELISEIRVNGKAFFDGNVQTVTRNFPSEAVDNLQIIDDYGEEARRSGYRKGSSKKVLNVNLEKDRDKGYFINSIAGLGTLKRHVAQAGGNLFNPKTQISSKASINNTNSQTLSDSNPSSVNQAKQGSFGNINGTPTNYNLTSDYRRNYKAALSTYLNLRINEEKNTIKSSNIQTNILPDLNLVNNQSTQEDINSKDNQINIEIDYTSKKGIYLKFKPSISFTESASNAISQYLISEMKQNARTDSVSGLIENQLNNKSLSGSNTLTVIKNFNKDQRTLSSNLSFNSDKLSSQQIFTNSKNIPLKSPTILKQRSNDISYSNNYEFRISQTEPIRKYSIMEFSGKLKHSQIENEREARSINIPENIEVKIDSLSNTYSYSVLDKALGASFQYRKEKLNVSVSAFFQSLRLTGISAVQQLETTFDASNFLPSFRLNYKISQSRVINFDYNTLVVPPAYFQLQPVKAFINPLYPSTGNPNLRPEYVNLISVSYNSFNIKESSSFNLIFTNGLTNGKIVSSVSASRNSELSTNANIQELTYENANGLYRSGLSYQFIKPYVKNILVATISGNIGYDNNISYINNLRTKGQNLSITQKINFRINVNRFYTETALDLQHSRVSFNNINEGETNSLVINTINNFEISNTITFNCQLSKAFNNGFSSSVLSNPLILNLNIVIKPVKTKNLVFTVEGYDIFSQNLNINRVSSGNFISDSTANRLSRYFLFTIRTKFSKI